jgi:hypothetical protein
VSDRTRTFASQLRHFAKSVGVVDDRTFDRIRQIVYRYVKEELDADYFELMVERIVDGQPGLITFWSSENLSHASTIRSQGSQYNTMIAASFDQMRPLWIVSPDRTPLRETAEYIDLWSNLSDLPAYVPSIERPIRTAIVLPLLRSLPQSRVLGVVCLETTAYIEITSVATKELQLLAEALAILFELWEFDKMRSRLTEEAMLDLADILVGARFPKLAKPKVYVSYSSRADLHVVNVIQETLHEFSDKVDMIEWNRISQPGSIAVQIDRMVATSQFGICYLSEPAKEASTGSRYDDDPNVLFEAGVLHALTSHSESQPSGWIPIREQDSSPAPFDFSMERIELVPRILSGELNEERFRSQLQRRLSVLLSGE